MTEIGKITPGNPLVTRVPRERPLTDHKEHQQEPGEDPKENDEDDEDGNNKKDKDGGIDAYV
jgi:hypothetical protein